MKAIILERRGDEAAVLCEDGTFLNRRVGGAVGETVELSAETVAFPTRKKNRWLQSAVAAALVLAVTGSTVGYTTASAYVSLDVEESSIELTVNHFGRVIAVNAVSEDAAELAESLSREVRHRSAADAIERTVEHLRDEGRLDDEDATVIAGVTSDNAKRKAELKELVECSVERGGGATAYVSEASRAEREQAREQHVSAGRFGFARDHGGFAEEQGPAETRDAAAEPAAPASGYEELPTPQEPQAEERAWDTPQPNGNDARAETRTGDGQPAEEPRHEPPAQSGAQPAQPTEPPAQGAEPPVQNAEPPAQGGEAAEREPERAPEGESRPEPPAAQEREAIAQPDGAPAPEGQQPSQESGPQPGGAGQTPPAAEMRPGPPPAGPRPFA